MSVRYVLQKSAVRLGVCLALWLMVDLLSRNPAYSGFLAGLMGACFLLSAWLKYLKSKGSDPFRRLRRPSCEVPYYLRSEKSKKPSLSLNGSRHLFDDGLFEMAEIPEPRRMRLDALACLIPALALLLWSQLM